MLPERIVFAGTPQFAVPALDRLIQRARPVAVLTQPDRPAGRGRRLTPSPVKQRALAAGIPVHQPQSLKHESGFTELAELRPDLIVTAAYGLLLPRRVLELPALGCWNLHASLLPRWRGASPIQQAVLAGDEQTGITLMQMDAGLDTGPMLLQQALAIGPDETAGQLHDRLAALAADVLDQALDALATDALPAPRPQNDAGATHAPRIEKRDAALNWSLPAAVLARAVRAYNPWPVAFGRIDDLEVRVLQARAAEADTRPAAPGTRLATGPDGPIRVACGRGVLEISRLQAPGRRPVSAREWLNAHPHWRRPAA